MRELKTEAESIERGHTGRLLQPTVPSGDLSPVERTPPFSWGQFALAGTIATLADTIGAPLGEMAAIAFDIGVAIFIAAVLRPKSLLLWGILTAACVAEAIPGLGLFPSWIVAMSAIGLLWRVLGHFEEKQP